MKALVAVFLVSMALASAARADSLSVAPPPVPGSAVTDSILQTVREVRESTSAARSDSLAKALRNTHPPVIAVRLSSPVNIDGVLSEPVWQNAYGVTDFKMRDPNEGAEPSQRTEVRIAYDDDAIYVGARCYDAHPESLLVRLSRRDVSVPADGAGACPIGPSSTGSGCPARCSTVWTSSCRCRG
jgi:hypothetical protein